jgi:hypothetical protein
MKPILAVAFALLVALGGLVKAFDTTPPGPETSGRAQLGDPQSAPTTSAAPATRFVALDVFIDPAGTPLAAYQFELKAKGGQAKLVGIEGGEHAAFRRAPYYDTTANVNDRVVIAAFDTGDDLPAAHTRVARVMLAVTGSPTYAADLQVAASADGKPVNATISVSEANPTANGTSEGAGQ